ALKPRRMAESGAWRAIQKDLSRLAPKGQIVDLTDLQRGAVHEVTYLVKAKLSSLFTPSTAAAYEARVLYGLCAPAPYLHNGSVPNLWELLKPAKDRISTFMVGSRIFDPKTVGFVTDQTPYKSGTFVTDSSNVNGNGNGGHEYGVTLTDDERWAII